ncbi:hypothetical protein [Bosea sp. (in: a-proteobacteria)]|uniref:hypothetical protein n=1 Tax=Bosea sp. (in: a-proteobacteria) TaxID=1871050 RepID=UPI003B3A0E2E
MEYRSSKPLTVPGRSPTVLDVPRVKRFVDLLIEGEKFEDAARSAGLLLTRARRLMRYPEFRKHYFSEIEVLNESERARNILLRRTLRDRGVQPDAPAALAKVALEAARQLDGDEKQGGITINGGQNVIAGYVIDLRGDAEGPRAITNRSADQAKPLISREDVTDVDG